MSPDERVLAHHVPRSAADELGGAHFGPAHTFQLKRTESDPDIVSRLEWLDDVIFAAIDGDPAALDGAAAAWKKAVEELGHRAVEESRLQYMRRAQCVWNNLRHEPNHPPHKVFAAIEVISILAGKAL
jgi:hypothetical protein